MPELVRYNEIAIGGFFRFNGIEYQKVAPVKKNCCKIKYNTVSKDGSEKIVVHNTQLVEPIQ